MLGRYLETSPGDDNEPPTFNRSPVVFFLRRRGRAENPTPVYPPPAEVRAAFHKLLDRPAVPLDVKVEETKTAERPHDGASQLRVGKASRRQGGARAGAGGAAGEGGQEAAGGDRAARHRRQQGGPARLARTTWPSAASSASPSTPATTASAPAAPRGRRPTTKRSPGPGRPSRARPQEHPFYYDTCWDMWRTVDYLQQRDDVDSERIGMIGFSMGGIETWLGGVGGRAHQGVGAGHRACRASAGAWTTTSGRAGPTRSSGAHEAAAQRPGRAEGQPEGLPRPVEQGRFRASWTSSTARA